MGLARFNKASNKFSFNGDNLDYVKLSDLELGKEYTVRGFFINTKSKFGNHAVIISDTFKADLPGHLLNMVTDIINNEEAVKDINAGTEKFNVVTYVDKNGVTRYSIQFI